MGRSGDVGRLRAEPLSGPRRSAPPGSTAVLTGRALLSEGVHPQARRASPSARYRQPGGQGCPTGGGGGVERRLRAGLSRLAAGVVEDGNWSETLEGSPLGASVSPLLANVYLHYVFDRWGRSWRRRHARGDIVVTRFADDFVVGFQHLGDAKRFLSDLRERFGKFNLELHPDKTRLIEFGRFAVSNRNSVVLGSRRRSSSWASRPFAGRQRTDGSGSGGSPSRRGCGRS
jgi:hypothetical protein